MLGLVTLLLLGADPQFKREDEVDGITVESRPVAGSSFAELRFSTVTTRSIEALCTEVYGEGKFDPTEPDLKSRAILSESADERVVYDRMTPPVVSPRSYAMRMRRAWVDGACHLTFEAANELAPAPEDGWVRVKALRGSWAFEPVEGGKTRLTYTVFTDPAGSVPALFVEGPRRKLGVTWVKRVLARTAPK